MQIRRITLVLTSLLFGATSYACGDDTAASTKDGAVDEISQDGGGAAKDGGGQSKDGGGSGSGCDICDSGVSSFDSSVSSNGDGGDNQSGDDSGVSTFKCSNVVHTDVPVANIEGLAKVIGLWKYSQDLSSSTPAEYDECTASFAFRIGPELLVDETDYDYAACILAQGALIPVSSGSINRPGTCSSISCPTTHLALNWTSPTSGSLFSVDDDGKIMGTAQARFVLYPEPGHTPPYGLLRAGFVSDTKGDLMKKLVGSSTVLECH